MKDSELKAKRIFDTWKESFGIEITITKRGSRETALLVLIAEALEEVNAHAQFVLGSDEIFDSMEQAVNRIKVNPFVSARPGDPIYDRCEIVLAGIQKLRTQAPPSVVIGPSDQDLFVASTDYLSTVAPFEDIKCEQALITGTYEAGAWWALSKCRAVTLPERRNKMTISADSEWDAHEAGRVRGFNEALDAIEQSGIK